jgi:hypothetical protein
MNFVTLPLKTLYKRAEDLAQAIQNCTHIAKGTNENNFTIANGIGYLVNVASGSTFIIERAKIIQYSTSLAKNWNSIGWYNESSTAESIAQNIT